MPSLFSNPTYKAKIAYNGFDMSHKKLFSSTTGHLLPVYYDILQPGDKVNLSAVLRTRTMPLASPAMAEILEHLEWFFVPIELIYHPFSSWYQQVNDVDTSWITSDEISQNFPAVLPAALTQLASESGTGSDAILNSNDAFGCFESPRLWDLLNMGYPEWSGNPTAIVPLTLCAYQFIYNDYYRMQDRETSHIFDNSLDQFYSDSVIPASSFARLSRMRYRPRSKDFFTNIFVSPLYSGSGSVADMGSYDYIVNSFHNWLQDGISFIGTNPSGQEILGGDNQTTVHPNVPVLTDGQWKKYMTPTAIRTSFAVEKMLEVTRRAGKTYDAQILAHFGVKVPDDVRHSVTFIGQQTQSIMIGDVIATSAGQASDAYGGSATSVLGELAGKGYSHTQSPKHFKFTAPSHGVLMCIYSAEVPQIYDVSGAIDKLNTLRSSSDWYRPAFDNLGMQPLFGFQCSLGNYGTSEIIGWQYRYSEYKLKYDTAHGALRETLSYWSPERTPFMDNIPSETIAALLCSPNDMDNFMVVPYEQNYRPSISAVKYDTDPLIHEIYFDVKKSSKMSTYGLPSL